MHPSRGSGFGGRGNSRPQQRCQSASGRERRHSSERRGPHGSNDGERGRGGRYRGQRGQSAGRRGHNAFPRGGFNREGEVDHDRHVERRAAGFRDGENGNENRRDNTPRTMTFGRLKTWAEMADAGELILFMANQRQQIETFLNQPSVRPDWIILFVKAVNHAITAQHQKESIRQLMDCLCKSRFFEHFATCIEEKQMTGLLWNDAGEFFQSLLNIHEEILNKFPQFAVKCVTGASRLLNSAPLIDAVQNNKTLLDALTHFIQKAKEVFLAEKEREKRQADGKLFGNNDAEKPPDNFIDLSVVPSKLDLLEDAKPFLRRAKTQGEYDDVEHYLDVQFRLMRQDFVLPLREGIADFKKNGTKKNYVGSELRIYTDVHIVGFVFKDGIDHILQFDITKLKKVKWEFSKRLIFGSLLCLSKDNFETVLFATVAHRDAKNLVKGIINVNFKTGLDDVFNSTSNDVFIMAETTAYFESYCHVLEGLKEMSKNLPLQDYIVKCKKDLRPPRYLLPSQGMPVIPKYDLSSLMKNNAYIEVAVLTTVNWPGADSMCLNKSQRDAAILALTKELAVIQGPPGTGKTYVGLKVMQVLIENMDVISSSETNRSPILVVCYTNHALDQFLEGVLEFCKDEIVRVGGKNNSEKLEQFNIKNLKEKLRKDNVFSNRSVKSCIYECRGELKDVSEKIENLHQIMDYLEINVLHEQHLEKFMKSCHFQTLTARNDEPGQKRDHIRKWLNASSKAAKSVIPLMIQRHLTELVLQWRCVTYNLSVRPDLDICQRASIYHTYLAKYKESLAVELQYLATIPLEFSFHRMEEIKTWQKIAENRILPDVELERVISDKTMKKIQIILGENGTVSRGMCIETWLLGLHRDLHSQLDDVQMLTNLMSGEAPESEMFDDDDASKQAQNDRIIDEDDEFGDSYITKSKAAMNNIASIMQRAHILGIKEENLQLQDEEDDGWQTVTQTKPLTLFKFQKKLSSAKPMTDEMEDTVENVWELKTDQRFSLYKLWIKRYKEDLTKKMQELVNQYTSAYERKKEINREEILFILRSAKVIGMTTTGAAKHRAVLQSVGCKIIVVEEAAEVLESHIITSLNRNCKHLILIGDHQQLRPSPTVYLLATEYGLEISLFERLIKNKVPHVLLQEQHRMRPEISKIMRHIYPDLQDHTSVGKYENIRGVKKNIFFIQHDHRETHVDDSKSKSNIHEANFLVALCQYLINQGYNDSEITILATYTGQVFAIKKTMKDIGFNHRVRVTAVDNFQGEENDIILLSLVRSNTENNVGFLKVDNRICVALSRAKKGLYVAGNFDLLASQSKLWKNIVDTCRQEEAIGEGLPVACHNHPDIEQIMTSAEDFQKCPDGGCGRPCDYKLSCGHVCGRKCHGYDLEHLNYECHKECAKECVNGHRCRRRCYQDCGDCMVQIPKQIPVCGHEDMIPCSVPVAKAQCSKKCDAVLGCEHQCPGKCGQCRKLGVHEKCSVPVNYSWPCGHSATVPCYMNPTSYSCQKECGANLICGHKCVGKCADCLEGSVHVACESKCGKPLLCGHICTGFCGAPCLPCNKMCPVACRHSTCFKAKHPPPCSHDCVPCKEPCRSQCAHARCRKLCSDVCDMKRCSEKCSRKLKCSHMCAGLCGELCVCAKCDKINILFTDVKDDKVIANDNDKINDKSSDNLSEVLNEPIDGKEVQQMDKKMTHKTRLIIKIPSCNHIFYVDELDKYINNFDPDGCSYIFCPSCQKPIFKCMRYEHLNKERSKKREMEKVKLKLLMDISKKQKTDLLMSQKKLADSVFLSGFHSMNVTGVKNQVEMQALSFKMKSAFILSEVASIIDSNSNFFEVLKLRKDAVLKVTNRLTGQQKSEFTTELLRCFWLAYLTHLDSLCKQYDVDVPPATRTVVKETIAELAILKPADGLLKRAQHVSEILSRRIKEVSTEEIVKAKCLLLEKSSSRVCKVMRSRDSEMLCELLEDGSEKVRRPVVFNQPASSAVGLSLKPSDIPWKQDFIMSAMFDSHRKKVASPRKKQNVKRTVQKLPDYMGSDINSHEDLQQVKTVADLDDRAQSYFDTDSDEDLQNPDTDSDG